MITIDTTPDKSMFYHVVTTGRYFSTDNLGIAQFEFANREDLGDNPKLLTTKEL